MKISKNMLSNIASKVTDVAMPKIVVDKYDKLTSSVSDAVSIDDLYEYTFSDDRMPFGLANSISLSQEYIDKSGSAAQAASKLIGSEVAKISGIGFLSSFANNSQELSNIQIVTLLQLRIINSLALIAGYDLECDETREKAYEVLQRNNSKNMMKKKALNGGVSMLRSFMPPAISLHLMSARVATEMLAGIVGSTIDSITTYTICKNAQAIFLDEVVKYEELVSLQKTRLKLLVNMALVDGRVDGKETELIKLMIDDTSLSESDKDDIVQSLADGKPFNVKLDQIKKDAVLSLNILSGLITVINSDGEISPSELLYLRKIARELSISGDDVNLLMTNIK